MKKEKKGKIAVLIPKIYDEFNVSLRIGIEKQAREENYSVSYFTNFSDNTSLDITGKQSEAYDEGESSIFRLIPFEDFDAIIMLSDFFENSQRKYLKSFVNNSCECPIINIRTILDGAINIVADEEVSFSAMIQHVIDVHHCQNISLLTGPKINQHSILRLNIFRDTLQKNHLPFDKDNVYYGDFWKKSGEDIFRQMQERNPKLPDAVICANDYMAMSLINEMAKHNIRVPEDILISGYDNIEEGIYFTPSLTTVSLPIETMGRKSVSTVTDLLNGIEIPNIIRMPSELFFRHSCGCEKETSEVSETYSSVLADRIYKTELLENSTTTLNTYMANANNISDCLNWLNTFALNATGFKSFALCLESDWTEELPLPDTNYIYQDTEIDMVMGIFNGKKMNPEKIPIRQLLPKTFLEDNEDFYYIIPLHYLRNYFGYAIFSISYNIPLNTNIKSWFLHLENALENIRIRNQLNDAVNKLQELYQRDTLTGLYNRRGFLHYSMEYYTHCHAHNSIFMILTLDMDGLKMVNDTYGHKEGDYCIITIAQALTAAAKNDEKCIRSGGDEYIVIGKDYSQKKLDTYLNKFYAYLDEKNRTSNKPYTISVSLGYHMIVPDASDVEQHLKIADENMYLQKRCHKKQND